MAKKKKHVQTEKERLFQEEAARKRAEKAAAAKRRRKKEAWGVLLIAGVLIALALGFSVWTITRMRNYETNYLTVKGTITDYKTHYSPSTKHSNWHYSLVISYRFEGREYELSDTAGFSAPPDELIGNTTEIYVNPQNPEQAKKVSTASSPSYVSAIAFPFGAVFYALGTALLLQERGSSFLKRALCIWLPLLVYSAASVLLYWVGLPYDGFGEVFSRVDGAIGYSVSGGLAVLAGIIDGAVCLRARKRAKRTGRQ